MGPILPFKQIIRRKQRRYRLATGKHLDTLRTALNGDTKQKLQALARRSTSICLPTTDEDNKIINGFTVTSLPDPKVGERLILVRLDTEQQVAGGTIIAVDDDRAVKIKLDKPLKIDKTKENDDESSSVVLEINFDTQIILDRKKRIETALLKFSQVSCSLPLHEILLGNYKYWSNEKFNNARAISLNDSLKLKGSQLKAVEESMKKRISLIEGVAGSGKTLVAASIAHSMHKYRNKKILLCSPIQATVDKLVQMLNDTKSIFVVKLPSQEKSNCHSDLVSDCSLESLVKSEVFTRGWQRTEGVLTRPRYSYRQQQLLTKSANRLVDSCSHWLKKQVERKILRKAGVVCCTLVQAGSPCLRKLNFDMLVIDDLQAASEPDCMIPMMLKGLKQVTLISEMRREIRLSRLNQQSDESKPNVSSKKAKVLKLNNFRKHASEQIIRQAQEPGGLFERWLSMGLTAVALRNQFRMHETLAAFSNYHYYLSRLKTDEETNNELTRQICGDIESYDHKFSWLPNNRCLTAFFDTRAYGGSVNEIVRMIIKKLVFIENVNKSRIGIITNECSNTSNHFDGIDIGTVKDFLGQERDFIILLARNDSDIELKKFTTTIDCNFLKDEDALLIAITRARLGQFIVTNLMEDETFDSPTSTSSQEYLSPGSDGHKLKDCDSWKALVRYYVANKLVLQVPTIGLD